MTHYILKISIHIQTIERLKKILQVRKFVAKSHVAFKELNF